MAYVLRRLPPRRRLVNLTSYEAKFDYVGGVCCFREAKFNLVAIYESIARMGYVLALRQINGTRPSVRVSIVMGYIIFITIFDGGSAKNNL